MKKRKVFLELDQVELEKAKEYIDKAGECLVRCSKGEKFEFKNECRLLFRTRVILDRYSARLRIEKMQKELLEIENETTQ